MDREMFEATEPILDDIGEVANELLKSTALEKLRGLLTELNTILGRPYAVSLRFHVDVFDTEQERTLPLLQTGLSGFEDDNLYVTWGDSTAGRYIVDGEMQIVPHDRCPRCWNDWDFKFSHPSCAHCGATLGSDVKVLLDTDVCPWCEEGTISLAHPVCDKCGFAAEPDMVTWG